MTELIISHDYNLQFAYLLTYLNKRLGTDFTSLSQIYSKSDIHVINNTKTDSIGIEDVKLLIKSLYFFPLEYKYQIGVIFYAQNLTIEAQNALLKTLEEQPENTIYMLLVNNEKNLLETIISRGQKHYVNEKTFIGEIVKIEEETEISVKHVEVSECIDKPLVEQLLFVEKIEEIEKENGGEYLSFLNELISNYRDKQIEYLTKNNNYTQISSKTLELINVAIKRIKANANKRATLENLLIQIHLNEKNLS